MENISILELQKKVGLSQSKLAKRFHLGIRVVQSWKHDAEQKILEYEERRR